MDFYLRFNRSLTLQIKVWTWFLEKLGLSLASSSEPKDPPSDYEGKWPTFLISRHKRRRISPIGGETASFPLRHPGVESHPVNKGIRITRRGGSSITHCARVMMRFCYPREGVYGVSSVESRMPPNCSLNDALLHWVRRLCWSIKVPVYQPGFGTKRMGSKW